MKSGYKAFQGINKLSETVIMLQTVVVSPENHESQSRTKKTSPKLKMLGPLCNQRVNLKTDSKTLYDSILKLIYSRSILKQNKAKRNKHR